MIEFKVQNSKFKIQSSKFRVIGLLLIISFLIIVSGCEKVEKPSIDGKGPLALQAVKGVDIMPWYHMPVDKWRNTHMDLINSGKVSKEGCLPCHYEPDKFCNKCHEYVGVKKVFPPDKNAKQLLALEIMEGLQPTPDHQPIGQWRTRHDEAIISGAAQITTCLGCHYEPDKFCNKCHVNAGIRKIPVK